MASEVITISILTYNNLVQINTNLILVYKNLLSYSSIPYLLCAFVEFTQSFIQGNLLTREV